MQAPVEDLSVPAREAEGSVVGLHGGTADNVGTALQVLTDISSGIARHFLAVRT